MVKISDPRQRQERSGPLQEGREIFVRNIDFKATEADVKALFEKAGKVETIRLPGKVPGRHQGFGFVVFEKKEDAERAVDLNDTKLLERNLNIQLSETKRPGPGSGLTRAVTPSVNGDAVSPAESATRDGASPIPTDDKPPPPLDLIKGKTLAILNLPDTVSDSRVRSIFEKQGPLRKVQLRPEHRGAIVEYIDVKDAGKAGLALEGYKFPGMTEGIKIGRMEDLLKQSPAKKLNEKEKKTKVKEEQPGKPGLRATIAAPIQAMRNVVSTGQRRRGGLGFVGTLSRRKEIGGGVPGGDAEKTRESKSEAAEAGEGSTTGNAPRKAKSNADFKAMFLRK